MNHDFNSDSMLSKYIHIKSLQARINGDLKQCSCLASLLHALHYLPPDRIELTLRSSLGHIFWAADVWSLLSTRGQYTAKVK